MSWYLERVKVKNDVTIPGGRIINAEGVNLLISATDDGTGIMVTRERKGNLRALAYRHSLIDLDLFLRRLPQDGLAAG